MTSSFGQFLYFASLFTFIAFDIYKKKQGGRVLSIAG
jgi:hypothetical protein